MTARANAYQYLPPVNPPSRDVARVVNEIRAGKIDCTGEVTLFNGSTSTVIQDGRLTERSVINLVPLSSGAAGVSWWQSTVARGSMTIGHADPGGDRDFRWIAFG